VGRTVGAMALASDSDDEQLASSLGGPAAATPAAAGTGAASGGVLESVIVGGGLLGTAGYAVAYHRPDLWEQAIRAVAGGNAELVDRALQVLQTVQQIGK